MVLNDIMMTLRNSSRFQLGIYNAFNFFSKKASICGIKFYEVSEKKKQNEKFKLVLNWKLQLNQLPVGMEMKRDLSFLSKIKLLVQQSFQFTETGVESWNQIFEIFNKRGRTKERTFKYKSTDFQKLILK